MATIKDMQMTLQMKVDEIVTLERIIAKLTSEITQKDSKITQLKCDLEDLKLKLASYSTAKVTDAPNEKCISERGEGGHNGPKAQMSAPLFLDRQHEWLKEVEVAQTCKVFNCFM